MIPKIPVQAALSSLHPSSLPSLGQPSSSHIIQFSSVSRVWFFAIPWTAARQASVHHQLPELAQTHVHWVSDAIQPSHSLSSPSPPAFNLSQHQCFFPRSQFFASGGQSIASFSFSISPSNEYSGLISFRIYKLDILAVLGTLKSLLQHYRSEASILWLSAFFIVQLSHPYMTTGKTIALTRQTFVSEVISQLFNMLYGFIDFLPSSKCPLN